MRKRMIAMLLGLTMCGAVSARTHYEEGEVILTPYAGTVMSRMMGNENSWKVGLAGGAKVQFFLTPSFSVSIGANYTHLGAKDQYQYYQNEKTGPYDYRLDYINTDYLAQRYFNDKLYIFAGFHLGWLFNAKSELAGHSTDIKDELHEGSCSVPVGIGCNLGKLNVNARFDYPINRLSRSAFSKELLSKKAREMQVMVTVGYNIQLL